MDLSYRVPSMFLRHVACAYHIFLRVPYILAACAACAIYSYVGMPYSLACTLYINLVPFLRIFHRLFEMNSFDIVS